MIDDLEVIIPINKNIKEKTLYVELALYYCKEGDDGLCLIQNNLFEIPLDSVEKFQDINLMHNILEYQPK